MRETARVPSEELLEVAAALGSRVVASRMLAGGFSHQTCLLTLSDGQVVVRLGGANPGIEAAVMTMAGAQVPVPRVLLVKPAAGEGRTLMALEYVPGALLSAVLSRGGELSSAAARALGAEVGRVVAGIGAVRLAHPGFFTDEALTVRRERPWSLQLVEVAEACMANTPPARLDPATRQAWVNLCAIHAPALAAIDTQARLVHADINPKNILVSGSGTQWRVEAVLDWEFAYSGSPYGDAANMARFAANYPSAYSDGFRTAFAEHQPDDLPLVDRWAHLGRVLDMFALSDLVTRPVGHSVAEQAAEQIRRWATHGVPADT
jgi:aminoglycoside phosphotransferase (APT) family kinase protein